MTDSQTIQDTDIIYIGNCVNSFDDKGNCIVSQLPYRDVTDFAQGEEKAKKISKKDFDKSVGHHEVNVINPTYLYDKKNDVYIIYDEDKGIHHFFV